MRRSGHVHLGNDQRHLRVHAPRAGVVDDHGARLRGDRTELARYGGAGGKEGNVHAVERSRAQGLDFDLAPGERQLLPRAARARERDQLVDRKLPLLENAKHFTAYGSGCTYDGHDLSHAKFLTTPPGRPEAIDAFVWYL